MRMQWRRHVLLLWGASRSQRRSKQQERPFVAVVALSGSVMANWVRHPKARVALVEPNRFFFVPTSDVVLRRERSWRGVGLTRRARSTRLASAQRVSRCLPPACFALTARALSRPVWNLRANAAGTASSTTTWYAPLLKQAGKLSSVLETPISLVGRSSVLTVCTLSDLVMVLFMLLIYRRVVRIVGRRILKPAGARMPEKWLSVKLIPSDEHGTVRWIESVERAVGLFLMLRLTVMACQFGLVVAARLGITIWPKLPCTISQVATIGYFAYVLDAFFSWFLSERGDLAPSQKFVLGRIGKVFIYATAFLLFIETTGLPLRSVLAFGGIGGLAIGLATQELAKNFISGIMLTLGAPFAPGESVQLNTIGVSGEVRQIGFYKTELIGADGRPTWIPNAQLVNERLTNNSRITKRRLAHRFGLRYQDIDKMGRIVDRLRTMLTGIPEIAASPETISVYFTEYAEYSLPIQLSCFVNVTDGKQFLDIQQRVLLSVNRIVKDEGADFALPTRTIEYMPTTSPR